MNKKYHEMKVEEENKALLLSQNAMIDYNIMMGNLQDPEQEDNTDE